MSYNNTRSRGNYNGRSVGRGGTNFVSGGQYKSNERPLIQAPGQQQQNQQQQYQQQQQQYQQQSYQSTQPQTPTQTPLKSIMKTKTEPPPTPTPIPTTPASVPVPMATDSSVNMQTDQTDTQNDIKPRRPWHTGAVNKISKKERRNRRNRRIGRLVRPKNAIMVLNELCGGTALKFEEIGVQNGLFGISVAVDNQIYEAYATSKNAAKQKACENALKGYISNIIKTKQQAREAEIAAGGGANATSGNAAVTNTTTTTTNNTTDDSSMQVDQEAIEDLSWCHLASFALYKLMDSWQDVSEIMPPDAIFQKSHQKGVQKPAKELPPNAADIHPAMLLHQMRPGIVIEDVNTSGQTPNIIYTVKVVIDGDEVYGQGPNKKTARKNCAQSAMEKHYGVVYANNETAST